MFFAVLSFGSTLAANAGPEDRYQRPVLDCKADAFGISTIVIREDNYGRNGVELELQLSSGSFETRVITETEFLKLESEELFLKMDGALTVTLAKRKVDQYMYDYILRRSGDGFSDSVIITCVE